MTWQSGVAVGLHNRHLAVFVDGQKVVATGGRLNRIGGDFDVAIGAVFEANRRGDARGQLAVDLAFGRARANRAPADQIAQVLRGNHVQKLAASRQAHAVDFNQQLACHAQAFVDAVAFIQVRVVDQALPAHGGAGFFEVHAHHDFQRAGVFSALFEQLFSVVKCGDRVVDGAWADDHQQAVVFAGHDVVDGCGGCC